MFAPDEDDQMNEEAQFGADDAQNQASSDECRDDSELPFDPSDSFFDDLLGTPGGVGDELTWVAPPVVAEMAPEVFKSSAYGAQIQFRSLATVVVSDMSCDDLRSTLEAVELAQRSLDATKAHLFHAVHSSGASDELGLTPPAWLADRVKLPSGRTRHRFKVTQKLLGGLLAPVIDEALSVGAIGWDHVEVLARVTNARNQHAMDRLAKRHIGRAQNTAFNRWKKEIEIAGSLFDSDGADPADGVSSNSLNLAASDDFTAITGQLTQDNAAVVSEAIEAVADELFRSYTRDNEQTTDITIPDRKTLRALALVELCRRGMARKIGSTKVAHPEVTLNVGPGNFSYGVTRWGDLVQLANSILFCAPDLSTVLTDRHGNPQFMGPGLPFPGLAPRPAGRIRPGTALDDALDDALDELEALLPEDWDRVRFRLDRGRSIRSATPEQRKALAARDGGCVFPGCEMPHAWTDAHHIVFWKHGGLTDIRCLISLCRRHHGVVHSTGWSVRLDPSGWTQWETPSGAQFEGQRHFRRRIRCSDKSSAAARRDGATGDGSTGDGATGNGATRYGATSQAGDHPDGRPPDIPPD